MSDSDRRDCEPPQFGVDFQGSFASLLMWRRDVRRFKPTVVDTMEVHELLRLAALAPSVGNSQPWRFVTVADAARRAAIVAEFERCNVRALDRYSGEQARVYASLKLEGLREAPVHLAVFCEEATIAGHGLGCGTMPETLRYSVVMAIHTFWLAARARGLGVGWVSILDPECVKMILDVPSNWSFVAYLCVGFPVEEHLDPELVRHGWQERLPLDVFLSTR